MEEAGGVEIRQQGELARWQAVGDQQNQAEVDDTDDPVDKEAAEPLPTTQLEIDKHRFRLRGIRTQQPPGRQRQSSTESYGANIQIGLILGSTKTMYRYRCHKTWPQVERDIMRVHHMRCSRRSKGRKIFEYLVDELSTWVTEDQLRISLSPTLHAGLKASSTDPLSRAQSEAHPKHPATLINDEHCHTSRTSRSPSSPSAPPGPAPSGEPEAGKRGGKREEGAPGRA